MKYGWWQIVHASVRGKAHEADETPCQDAHTIVMIDDTRGVAVVSDGAGSKAHSHIGSQFVSQRAAELFSALVRNQKWCTSEQVPELDEWRRLAIFKLKQVKDDLAIHAQNMGLTLRDVDCTVIVVAFSPHCLLSAHIGDGRAGYSTSMGVWKPLITPFKGEEVGTTVFITLEVWDRAEEFIECQVVCDNVDCFVLMSDGCEKVAFQCNVKDENEEKCYSTNDPYMPFLAPNVITLRNMREDHLPQEEINAIWADFLAESPLPALKEETDDKTMILGVLVGHSA